MNPDSERAFRDWMLAQLAWASIQLELTATGPTVWGWASRSASQPARAGNRDVWVRVGSEQQRHLPHPCWDGIPTANTIHGVPKPVVLGSVERDTTYAGRARKVRADVMTRLPGTPCTAGEILREEPELTERWWHDLRSAYDTIRATPEPRHTTATPVSEKARRICGEATARKMAVTAWEAAHGDLHWGQLLYPKLGILDWEMWGRMPIGTDPAVLYCCALLVPSVAGRVWHTFADVLDTDNGRVALFRAAVTLLHRAPREYPELADLLRNVIDGTTSRDVHWPLRD